MTNSPTALEHASATQSRASDPDYSTWVSANAGSGKTRVLTSRVARLLYKGVQPNKIVCLTYTQAAAREMQNRLFDMLGQWAMAEAPVLADILQKLEGKPVTPQKVTQSRRLFAQALETPGGLQIQTIHAFCASILRRFPLEAGVPPEFKNLEGQEEIALQRDVFETLLETSPRFKELFELLLPYFSMSQFDKTLQNLVSNRIKLTQGNDTHSLGQRLKSILEIPQNQDRQSILQSWYADFDRDFFSKLHDLYRDLASTKGEEYSTTIKNALNQDMPTEVFSALEPYFLTKDKDLRKTRGWIVGAMKKQWPECEELILSAQDWYYQTFLKVELQKGYDLSIVFYEWISLFFDAYRQTKQEKGVLDFTDQILKARDLLVISDIRDWVRYKMDGGIDHLLVDEAQDTSPEQWDVIRAITDDFFDGDSTRETGQRTIFAVGDEKQSIYSFQGASPEQFSLQGHTIQSKAGHLFQDQPLQHSFRSSATILDFVDRVFTDKTSSGLTFGGQTITHIAAKDIPGRVDVWPLLEPDQTDQVIPPFWQPQAIAPTTKPRIKLARTLATEIERMLTDPQITFPGQPNRRVEPGDILVLVRKRDVLQQELIRCLKKAGIPTAGTDRLKISDELIVKDLLALAQWCLAPYKDDLNLACVLRSPLCNMSDDNLFSIAHKRKGSLWEAVQNHPNGQPHLEFLLDMLSHTNYERPFEFFSRALFKHTKKALFVKRLGQESQDALDAFMDQCIAFENGHTPTLHLFVPWMRNNNTEIKRAVPAGSHQVRIMTTHGAKGLEAPIVILPDLIQESETKTKTPEILAMPSLDATIPLWTRAFPKNGRGAYSDAISKAYHRQTQSAEEENKRLLYVALTRAEQWLIICGHKNQSEKIPPDCWWAILDQRDLSGGVQQKHPGFSDASLWHPAEFWRIESELSMADTQRSPTDSHTTKNTDLPDWLLKKPSHEKRPAQPTSPSAVGQAQTNIATEARENSSPSFGLAYGTLVHKLLELERYDQKTANVYNHSLGLSLPLTLCEKACEEAQAVLVNPELSHLFTQNSLCEVDISGHIDGVSYLGRIDRLVIDDQNKKVWLVDYKTGQKKSNAVESYAQQLSLYKSLAEPLYPSHTIVAGIIWTNLNQFEVFV